MLSISSKSNLIRNLGTGRAFKDTQRALKHLRHSDVMFGHSEGTQRALGGLLSTRRALGHSKSTRALRRHSALRHLRHLDTRILRALRHLGTRALKVLGHSGTWALEARFLADSFKCDNKIIIF